MARAKRWTCPLGEGGDPRLYLKPRGNPTNAPICKAVWQSRTTGATVRCIRPVDEHGRHLVDCIVPRSAYHHLHEHFGDTPRVIWGKVETQAVSWATEASLEEHMQIRMTSGTTIPQAGETTVAIDMSRDKAAKVAALWACERRARSTYNLIQEVDTVFSADLGTEGEECLRKAKLLAIELERMLSEGRAWAVSVKTSTP